MTLGKNIKLFRTIAGLKQKKLAQMVEIQESYLSSIENDKKEPSLSLLKRISKSLNIPLSMFFWEETDNLNNDSPATKIKKLLIELTKEIHKPKASDSSNHV